VLATPGTRKTSFFSLLQLPQGHGTPCLNAMLGQEPSIRRRPVAPILQRGGYWTSIKK
jgi:hypothetical protein